MEDAKKWLCKVRMLENHIYKKPIYTRQEILEYITQNEEKAIEQINQGISKYFEIFENADGIYSYVPKLSDEEKESKEEEVREVLMAVLVSMNERLL